MQTNFKKTVIIVCASSLAAFKLVELILGAIRVGSNIDEPYHHEQASLLINTGSYITQDPTVHEYAYGPAFGFFAHIVNVLLQNTSYGEIILDPKTLIISHLLVTSLGLLTAFAIGITFYAIHKNIIFSILTALILLSFPFWIGHIFQNIKDVPVAYGISSFLASVIMSITKISIINRGITLFLIYFFAITGIFFSVGTRPSILVFLILIFLIYLLFSIAKRQFSSALFFSSTIGGLLTLQILPQFYTEPANAVKNTFLTTSDFPWQGSILMRGELIPPIATIEYFLIWFFAQTPLILLFLLMISLYQIILYFIKNNKNIELETGLSYFLIFLQIVMMPLIAIILSATVYQSLRHFLFIFPAVAIIISSGLLLNYLKLKQKYQHSSLLIILISLLFINIQSFKLNPYNYTYYNPLITKNYNVPLDWETESWWVSNREAIEFTPANGSLTIWDGVWDAEPFIQYRGKKVSELADLAEGDYWAVSTLVSYVNGDSRQRAIDSRAIYSSQRATCTIHHAVVRELWHQVLPMAYVSRCQRSGSYLEGIVSIAWSSLSEVDTNGQKFSWLLKSGDSIRISTLRDYPSSGVLSFSLEANPCKSKVTIKIIYPEKKSETLEIPIDDSKKIVQLKFDLKPYTYQEIKIIPESMQRCKIFNDERNFLAKIANINWTE